MPRKKHTAALSNATYYVLGIQLGKDGNLWGIPGDQGLLVDTIKMTNMQPSRQDQMKRIYKLEPWVGSTFYECQCGLKFATEQSKNAHGQRRHSQKRRPLVKDLHECSEEERESILAEVDRYETAPNQFNIPDPEDREMSREDRELADQIDWSKTAASNQ
jgi:hypothetical protein